MKLPLHQKLSLQLWVQTLSLSSSSSSLSSSMASAPATPVRLSSALKPTNHIDKAKPETVQKVMDIVKQQLALSNETTLTPETQFTALGADSLDTVEIVMGFEEEFGVTVEEDNSQNITTVQEAADLIEKLLEKKEAESLEAD